MIVLEAERLNQERERSGLSCTPFAQQKISLHALCTDTELKQPLARLGSTKGKLTKSPHGNTKMVKVVTYYNAYFIDIEFTVKKFAIKAIFASTRPRTHKNSELYGTHRLLSSSFFIVYI